MPLYTNQQRYFVRAICLFLLVKTYKAPYTNRENSKNSVRKIIPNVKIDYKRRICDGYIGELSDEHLVVAHAIAKEMNIEEVEFFRTSRPFSFANDFAFPHIGIQATTIELATKARYSATYKALNIDALLFKRELYHELWHIRERNKHLHSPNGWIDNATVLSNEMEAELAAHYYLFKIDGIAQFPDYRDHDDFHPSKQDHHRYLGHLYAELMRNPKCELDILAHLRSYYFKELKSSRILLPDISAQIKQDLIAHTGRKPLKRCEDIWFYIKVSS